MSKALAMAAAAATLTLSAPANAAVVLWEQSGVAASASIPLFELPRPGVYKLEAFTSGAATFSLDTYYNYHWDVFFAPAPRPHNQYIEGNSDFLFNFESFSGQSASVTFTVHRPSSGYFKSDAYYQEVYGIPIGTGLYSHIAYEDPTFGGFMDSASGSPVDYTFRITQVSTAPIPEPATWAMLIVGFGLAGSALRRARGRSAPRLSAAG